MKPEHELITALQAKDPAAFQQLIALHSDALYRLALRVVKDNEKAREVVQEALLKATKGINNFEGRSSLKTWMYRITYNEALMAIRKELPRLDEDFTDLMPHYEAKVLESSLPQWSDNPESVASDNEFKGFYQQCVSELPETLRTVYVLKDIEQVPEQEISEILKITKSAVKNRAHRARLLLRKKIEAHYGS